MSGDRIARTFVSALVRTFAAVMVATCFGQTVGPTHTRLTPGEARASRALDAAKKRGTADLYAFLKNMPKGGDLHMHIDGAVYAETFLAQAVRQGLCIDPVAMRIIPPAAGTGSLCGPETILAGEAVKDQKSYDRFIDSASMRNFVPRSKWDGHDHFFAAFGRVDSLAGKGLAEWLDEVATRAAEQNQQYLEIMAAPGKRRAVEPGSNLMWPADAQASVSREQLAGLRDELLANGLRDRVPALRKMMDDIEAEQRGIERCAENGVAKPPCRVKIHYLWTVLRTLPPAQVFTSALVGFELAGADPRFVGVNILAPEDDRVAMRDYHLHMQIFDYLHRVYPKVHLTLHAGELAPGMVPPDGLRFHVREAIELGHAERIGHGVDVLYEDHAPELLKEMAARHILVEINLTSNDIILGVKGADHPLSRYRAAHVPVALSTDDEGVSRIDITHEYVKGVEEQHLGYIDLKQMARASLEHAFLHGDSLWTAPDDFTHRKAECAAPVMVDRSPRPACAALLKASEKAAGQWELERRFAAFEGAVP
jgi:adenosine deaminase